MRGILAQAATHLSRLRSAQNRLYANKAAEHHHAALPEYRTALAHLDRDNCQAVSYFAKKLLWCHMARDESLLEDEPGMGHSWLPQWFTLLVGSCRIVQHSRAWLPAGPLAREAIYDQVDRSENPDCEEISRLAMTIPSLRASTELLALHEAFFRSSLGHHNTPHRNGVNHWIESLSDEFITSLQGEEPSALILLAHFCVLLHRSEEPWFMNNHSARLLLSIVNKIGSAWMPFLEWPCHELSLGWT